MTLRTSGHSRTSYSLAQSSAYLMVVPGRANYSIRLNGVGVFSGGPCLEHAEPREDAFTVHHREERILLRSRELCRFGVYWTRAERIKYKM